MADSGAIRVIRASANGRRVSARRDKVIELGLPLTQGNGMNLTVRCMTRDDVPYVSQIDREAFPTDWPPPSFGKELNSSIIRYVVALDDNEGHWRAVAQSAGHNTGDGWRAWMSRVGRLLGRGTPPPEAGIALDGRRIVGYASLWLMVDEAHLTSIAVREARAGASSTSSPVPACPESGRLKTRIRNPTTPAQARFVQTFIFLLL